MLPEEPLNRRNMFILGGAIVVSTLPLGGCIFLLRLFAGRGLAGALRSAVRVGRTTSALTFGRGIAIGTRLAPTRTIGVNRGIIVGPRQRLIANFETTEVESQIIVDRSPVFFSRKTRYGFDHNDYNGPCGRSIYASDNTIIRHETDDGILVAIDRLNKARNVVEHLEPDSSKIGETRYDINSGDVTVFSDTKSVDSVNNIRTNLGFQCPEAKEAYDDWMAQKKLCSENGAACRDVSGKSEMYNRARDACGLVN